MKNLKDNLGLRQAFGIALVIIGQAFTATAQERIKITRADELPRRTMALKGKVGEIYANDALLKKMADEIYQNAQNDMKKYDIQDKATLGNYYSVLILIDFSRGNYDEVTKNLELSKALEDKEEELASTGLFTNAYIKAAKRAHSTSGDAFKMAFKEEYARMLSDADKKLIRKYVDQTKVSLTLIDPARTVAAIETQLQPYIDNGKGQVPEAVAFAILSTRYSLELQMPIKDQTLEVLTAWQEKNKVSDDAPKVDFWKERNAALEPTIAKNEVILAIWDTGVDPVPYLSNMWVNKNEIQGNGKDEDRNGFIDDVYGIAFGIDNKPAISTLLEPAKLTYDKKDLQKWMKGAMDLQSSITSKEATDFQQRIMSLKPEEGTPFQEDLGWYSTYAHGTHVTGIALAGNPVAKIMYARLSYDTRTKPRLYTDETQQNQVSMFTKSVAYFKAHNVRVVNMSWRYNASAYEGVLAMYGIGKDEQERKAIASKWFEAERKALKKAFESAPEILFVCGSGNENNDANFSDYVPAGIDLPNLITIGAVNDEGKRTSFTTEGKSVDFYANGYEIESFVPGGDRMKFSGTSMASPQVVNLAGKLLAINPSLTPVQLIEIIRSTSTPDPENKGLLLIHPKNAINKVAK
ncbi:hypothetical protein BH09BAC3_BH09BAC3_09880 [soil metagenome]